MATKPITTDVATVAQYNAAQMNANFAILEDAVEGCLGRDGTDESPNSMTGVLDMDLNQIQNLPTPLTAKQAVNKAYVDGKIVAVLPLGTAQITVSKSSGDAVDWDAVNNNSITTTFETYAELRGINAFIDGDAVVLLGKSSAGDGGGGVFRWDDADWSTEVTADTDEKFYIAPNSDTTGASGAWIRTDNTDKVIPYESLSKLMAAPPYMGAVAYVEGRDTVGDGGEGVFCWDASDLSTEVTADSLGGVYVAPTSDSTGASGAWVRQYSGAVSILWFMSNSVPGTTLMTTAIQAALDFAHDFAIGHVFAPAGTYLTGNINWPGNNISLKGTGSAYTYSSVATPRTIFEAAAATTIIFDLVQTGAAEDRQGNHLSDFAIDGNSIAAVGIDTALANIYERIHIQGCTTAGMRLANFTNSTRILESNFSSNSGWGLLVEGVSSTTFSIENSVARLNTLGGINLEAGVRANFENCVVESNTGPGLRLYKPSSHTNAFGLFQFTNCWFENNASASPYYTLVVSAGTSNPLYGAFKTKFKGCHFSTSVATRKYMNVTAAKHLEFEDCDFGASTEANTVNLTINAQFVSFINSTGGTTGISGITDLQIDNAIAQGLRCWSHDIDKKRYVGSGAPAAGFQNSWVNYGSSHVTTKYWLDRNGSVHIEGEVAGGTPPSTVFTLPVGYRPTEVHTFIGDANNAHAVITVTASGLVTVSAGSTTITSLNGINFTTA